MYVPMAQQEPPDRDLIALMETIVCGQGDSLPDAASQMLGMRDVISS
jgi:hypothetical protein